MGSSKVIVPFGFSMLESGLYRSSYPVTAALPYIETLKLKTIISVDGSSARGELLDFIAKHGIQLIEHDVGMNQEPFEVMDIGIVSTVVRQAIDVQNLPCFIYSSTEKVGLSVICGCIRKAKKWPLTSIMREFEQFAEPEGSFHDIQYIHNFELGSANDNSDDASGDENTVISSTRIENVR